MKIVRQKDGVESRMSNNKQGSTETGAAIVYKGHGVGMQWKHLRETVQVGADMKEEN